MQIILVDRRLARAHAVTIKAQHLVAAAILLTPGAAAVWDGRFEITAREPGWRVAAAAGRLARLSEADRRVAAGLPAAARGGLPHRVDHREILFDEILIDDARKCGAVLARDLRGGIG